MKLRAVLLGTVFGLGLASTASADAARHGWYVGLEGAWVHVNDTNLGPTRFEFENRWGALATFGHAFDNNMRLELEVGYRNNDLGQVNNVNVTDGDITDWTGMLNVLYDERISSRWLFDIGVGVGFDEVRLDREIGGLADSDVKIAAQGIVGLTHRLSDHWDLALTYRYLWVDQPELFLPPNNDLDVTKHTVSLGFRYGYDEPPPPPAPAPPPPPPPPPVAKQFIIFFGFNKCNITAEADAVLSEAAAAAKSTGAASVRVVGHTDTVGSDAYNQKLSECRANAAKTNLVGKGIADGAISTSGKGESELMVQTGDGVKEPQNRRATVDLN